jgi:hypothetical protein
VKKVCAILSLSTALLLPNVGLAEESENHLAVDLWGLSYHGDRDQDHNERNWGIGLRAYHGNWFAAVDQMKNSFRGKALAVGVGYEYPLTTIAGYTLSAEAELLHLDYEKPGQGAVNGWGILPALSLRRGDVSMHVGVIPPTESQKGLLLFFLTYHFSPF